MDARQAMNWQGKINNMSQATRDDLKCHLLGLRNIIVIGEAFQSSGIFDLLPIIDLVNLMHEPVGGKQPEVK